LKDRGKLSPGYFADVIVFDEKTIADRATYENPEVFAEGVKYVIVNGKVAIDGGKFAGALGGRALRKSANREGLSLSRATISRVSCNCSQISRKTNWRPT